MDFKVVDHPRAIAVEDDIFHYLVVLQKNGTVDVFRFIKGAAFDMSDPGNYRTFFDFAHFEQRIPETARAIILEREQNKNSSKI